jgi:dipeptidyl aminopeptidase/acylaminoacyl peptidase
MIETPTLPFGSWPTPISVDLAVGAGHNLSEPLPDGDDIYLLEARPEEAGRVVLLRLAPDGTVADMAPDLNVRTRVHEYGGGAYTVRDGRIVFSEFADNRLMLKPSPADRPTALVSDPALRFADLELDVARDRVIAVLEDQHESAIGARNLLCGVSLADGTIVELASGRDFYSDPRLSPDGSMVFISDRSGWFNLYRWRAGSADVQPLAPMAAEFAGAQWVFGLSDYAIDTDGTVVAACFDMGRMRLWAIREGEKPRDLQVSVDGIDHVRARDGAAFVIAAFATRPRALVRIDLRSGEERTLRAAADLTVDPAYLSVPQHLAFPTSGGRTAYAWYYPPTNPDVAAPEGESPPLVVMSHGGPTSQARIGLSLERQAFTSRGFAVVDVDYGGSTGYGRPFRDQLREHWGIVDVDDCTNAALWLAEQGLADRRRLAIRGGSAGGYTTLAALCFRDVFTAGTSFYGLGDLEAFAAITHKFESRYMDILVGPYPEQVERYRERSPDRFADRISCPVLVMQGADDRIVPPSQAEGIVAALERNGLPHAYLLFEGEGHGFRQAASRRRALEAELSFYAQVFGFGLSGAIKPLEITGLSPA